MHAMKKKVLAAVGISVLALGYYSMKKYKAAKAIVEKLVVRPKDIKDVHLSFDKISFALSLELQNHTHFDLGFTTGSHIGINRIKIFTPTEVLLADVYTDISAIELPANGSYTISNLRVEIPTHNLLSQFDNVTEYVTNNSLLYELYITAFGKEFSVLT